ncbi:uncharacterized protein [Watersipora subatra]|uniref:uncharacterized protein n=1 Tax=Watersipora subatra TaxID=2589382 RepID=UPI00355AE3F2
MGSLTRRPYLLVGFFHMIIGLLLCACGVVWLVMTFKYWGERAEKKGIDWNVWQTLPMEHQVWAWLVYTVEIWTGFWIMMSGSFAMCVKDSGCLEKLFFFMNVSTMILFAPAAVVLSLEIFFNVADSEGASLETFSFIYKHKLGVADQFNRLELNSGAESWILAFPIIGISLGFIEFILSMVSVSVCACCRPTRSYSY